MKIPSMVKAELLHGAAKSAQPVRNRELVELFLAPFEIVTFDDDSALQYGQIRSALEQVGQVIGFNDLIIASTVMAHQGVLVSTNTKEFLRIKGLKLETWSEVPFNFSVQDFRKSGLRHEDACWVHTPLEPTGFLDDVCAPWENS